MLPNRRHLPKGLAIATQSKAFWRRLAPELTISDTPWDAPRQAAGTCAPDQDLRMRLVNDGYLHLRGVVPAATLPALGRAVRRIGEAGLPAGFIGVYDEVWSLLSPLKGQIDSLFADGAALVPNFRAVHPGQGRGNSAGRRRAGLGVYGDGTPRNVTVWLPLTPATPANGCLYVVPARFDRNYGRPDAGRPDASLPGIMALPAEPGDLLIWTGETYTWQGLPARDNPDGPALSLSWEFQSRSDAPLEGVVIDSFPRVPFETRLAILARQIPQAAQSRRASPVWRAVRQTLENRYPLAHRA